MNRKVVSETSNAEMVTIPRAEYEEMKGVSQNEKFCGTLFSVKNE